MNKLLIIIASMLFFIVSITSLYSKGITYSGSAPVVTGTSNDAAINNALQSMFSEMLNNAQDNVSKIETMSIFLRSMASANTSVSSAATQINYPSYDLFAITLGVLTSRVGFDGGMTENIAANGRGDRKYGTATQPWALQAGFNAGFLLDGLYLAAKFGYSKSSQTYGFFANYNLIKEQSLTKRTIWRGLNLGTGFVHQKNKTNITVDTNIQYFTTIVDDYLLRMLMKPNFLMQIKSGTSVIPIEMSTAIGIAFGNIEGVPNDLFTINTGIGVDISYGRTTLDIKNKAVLIQGLHGTPPATTITYGELNVHANIKEQRPYYFSPKIMLGLSFEAGPFIITFPAISFYLRDIKDAGANIELSAGLVF